MGQITRGIIGSDSGGVNLAPGLLAPRAAGYKALMRLARVLGIESSCDDTAAAVVEDGRRILSSVVSSQVAVHGPFGGVVPELASRSHISQVIRVVDEALQRAGCDLGAIDAVAATSGPGLVGSLLVGLQVAKAIAHARRLPFIGVNHLEGHLYAIFLGEEPPSFPFVALLVSGGHTCLYHARSSGDYRLLGETRDDAAGEAFDKSAKMLGLPYPGGVSIERAANGGNPKAVPLPRPLPRRESLDFSFSGLKTAVRQVLARGAPRAGTPELADLCASVQEAIVDVLVRKSIRAVRRVGAERLVLAGGVAANTRLRERMQQAAAEWEFALYLPAKPLCTDNAAMIAAAGYARLERGERSDETLNAVANLPLGARS
jgi:N6-L-threonylcarbamoyladenine synthase